MAKKIMHRKMPDKNYAWQSHSLYEYFDVVSIGGIALYGLLTTYDYGTHIVFPSRRTLAKRMGVCRNSVGEYLTELEKAKLIKTKKRYGKRNRLPDLIHLLKIKQRGVAQKVSHVRVAQKVSHGGSESEQGVAQKVSRNKKNRIKRTKKENTAAEKRSSSESVSEILFENSKTKLSKQKLKDSFEYKCSVKLCDSLKSKGKIIRTKINLKEWARHFRELMQFKTKKRIKIVLNWYLNHLRERWCPKLYCARTFKEHFARIEDAMRRKGDKALLEDEQDEQDEQEQVDDKIEPIDFTDKRGKVKRSFERQEDDEGYISVTERWTDNKGQKHGTSYEITEDELEDYLNGEEQEDNDDEDD